MILTACLSTKMELRLDTICCSLGGAFRPRSRWRQFGVKIAPRVIARRSGTCAALRDEEELSTLADAQ